ncbi:MAG: 3,5-cyclic-AMP phosphodiesterase [Ilumatobacteraceae bacterium]
MDITTVADDLIVAHRPGDGEVVRLDGLHPGSIHHVGNHEVQTLPRPSGELLCRVGTVNDLHFGELECGKVDDDPRGPIQRVEPGEPPHPLIMNRAAVAEMASADLAAVVVKGDLSSDGTDDEFAAFEACYRDAFADRLHVVRGNHDSYHGQLRYAGDDWIDLPGVSIALLDTVLSERTTGSITAAQLEWLDDRASAADRPVIVMGHHQQWVSGTRHADYFGLDPDSSDALDAVTARRSNIVAYTAGHTHRHRVRPMSCGVPSVEVGCVKDFPGTWAEYRVYQGGIMQVVHRMSSPEALSWSERCRHLLADFDIDYENYALGRLEDRCFNIPLR